MPAREIPRRHWREFFDAFSRQHEGWRAAIETEKSGRLQSRHLPLAGISADSKGSEPDAIEISLGGHIRRIVHRATRVRVLERADGAHDGIEIESADGGTTTLRFRAAVRPELLNGVLGERRAQHER
jgi:hypothetical protein